MKIHSRADRSVVGALIFLIAVCVVLAVKSAFASVPAFAYLPILILYQNGKPAVVKIMGEPKKTMQDCIDDLKAPVAMVTSRGAAQGIVANGGCFPIPPPPSTL